MDEDPLSKRADLSLSVIKVKFAERTTQRESTGSLQGAKHGVQTGRQRGGKEGEDLMKSKSSLVVD